MLTARALFLLAVVAEAGLGIGFTFYSGALEAWAVDGTGHRGGVQLRELLARGQYLKNIVYSFAGIAGVALFFTHAHHCANPFLVSAIVVASLLLHAERAMMSVPTRASNSLGPGPLVRAVADHVKSVSRYGLGHRDVALLLLSAAVSFAVLQSIVFFWPYYLIEVAGRGLYSSLSGTASWLAVAWCLAYVARASGNWAASKALRKVSPSISLTVGLGIGCIAILLLYWLPNLVDDRSILRLCVSVALYAVARFAEGVAEPIRQQVLNERASIEDRATLLSLGSATSMLVSTLVLAASACVLSCGLRVAQLWGCIGLIQLCAIPLHWRALTMKGHSNEQG